MKKKLLLTLIILFAIGLSSFAQYEATINYVSEDAITIDGEISEWAKVEKIPMTLQDSPGEEPESDDDLSASWMALWSDDGLYVVVEVNDDVITPLQDGWNDWDPDQVEFYFDPTGERLAGTFNTAKCSQYRVIPGGTTEVGGDIVNFTGARFGEAGWLGYESPDSKLDIVETEGVGYIIEILFDWVDIFPEGDKEDSFGFTMNIGDSDGEDIKRNAILLWAGDGEEGQSSNPSLYGELTLSDEEYKITSIKDIINGALLCYPNPVEDVLNIKNVEIGSGVSILNIAGQKVKTFSASTNQVSLDVAALKAGVYFVQIKGHTSKIVIK